MTRRKLLPEPGEEVRHIFVGDPNADKADAVICRRVTEPLILADNLVGTCANCGHAVQFRPHAPKSPPRVCDECYAAALQQHNGAVKRH